MEAEILLPAGVSMLVTSISKGRQEEDGLWVVDLKYLNTLQCADLSSQAYHARELEELRFLRRQNAELKRRLDMYAAAPSTGVPSPKPQASSKGQRPLYSGPIRGAMGQSGAAGFVHVNKGQMSSDGMSRTRTTAVSFTPRTSPRSPTRSPSPSPRDGDA